MSARTAVAVFVYPSQVSGVPVKAYGVAEVRETPTQWHVLPGTARVVWERYPIRFETGPKRGPRYWKGGSGAIGSGTGWRLVRVLTDEDAPRAIEVPRDRRQRSPPRRPAGG